MSFARGASLLARGSQLLRGTSCSTRQFISARITALPSTRSDECAGTAEGVAEASPQHQSRASRWWRVGAGLATGAAALTASSAHASTPAPSPAPSQPQAAPVPASSPRTRAGEGSDFVVYRNSGVPVPITEVVARLLDYDVVLLGEVHDDPVAHNLELWLLQQAIQVAAATRAQPAAPPTPSTTTITSSSDSSGNSSSGSGVETAQQPPPPPTTAAAAAPHPRPRRVVLSLEMFERDVQVVMDEFLAGTIRERDFFQDARPWPNYEDDYRPLVLAARAAGVPVLCANAPRRYVSMVGRHGAGVLLEAAQSAGRAHLPPLPYSPASAAYCLKIQRSMGPSPAPPPPPPPTSSASPSPSASPTLSSTGRSPPLPAGASPVTTSTTHVSSPASERVDATLADAAPDGAATAEQPGGCPYIGLSVSSNFVDAQALWDASMASAIADALLRPAMSAAWLPPPPPLPLAPASLAGGSACPAHNMGAAAPSLAAAAGSGTSTSSSDSSSTSSAGWGSSASLASPLVVHVCGKFHSEHGLGIVERLRELAPGARVLTVSFEPTGGEHDYSGQAFVSPQDGGGGGGGDGGGGAAGLHITQDAFRAAGHQYAAHYVILTDGTRARSFEGAHPV